MSCDFNHNPHSSICDLTLTKVDHDLVKITAWYDNEWGFSNRMLDTAVAMMEANCLPAFPLNLDDPRLM